ncbi:MAG: hypothetical protein ACI9GH_000207 [Candidatus Paceibacteria bacterium]|jgi:uncharacterized protein YqeY
MTLQQQIREDIKGAMKAKDATRLTVLRGLLSAFTNELVANGKTPQDELPDQEVLAVIKRGSKQRKDAIDQFTKGGRTDLVENEEKELNILEEFLPQMISKEEIQKVVDAKKEELGITDKSGMGQLIGAVMKELAGTADGCEVKDVVESSL